MNTIFFKEKSKALLPWAAGASFALGHIAVTQCTLTKEGQCVLCGGCVFALTGLVGWAVYKDKYTASEDKAPQAI